MPWTPRFRVLLTTICLLAAALAANYLWPRYRLLRLTWRYRSPPKELEVPVEGLTVKDLRSTFGAPRSGHRTHQGADIFAKSGTPVRSASNGVVVRVGVDTLGGNVVWVAGEGRSLYYYAHLREPSALTPGTELHRGDEVGLVGNTGNARTTPPHLHFGIYRLSLVRSRAIDPIPELQRLAVATPAAR